LRFCFALGFVACASSAPVEEARISLIVTAKPGLYVDWSRLEVDTTGARRVISAPDRLVIEYASAKAPSRITLKVPTSCPKTVELSGGVVEAELEPWLSVQAGDLTQLGFDRPFRITLTPGCTEATQTRVSWRQTEGPSLQLSQEQNGLVLSSRTLPLASTHPEAVPWGVVPFSPRTRGKYHLVAEWSGAHLDLDVSASARTTGLPSVTLGEVLHLGGTGWRVIDRPRNSRAEVESVGGLTRFRPDARGRWRLEDGNHRELALTAGKHEETPLDCGRSDCHANATRAAVDSPMTTIFSRGMKGQLPDYDPNCALACHTAGEPGLDDGGFVATMKSLGFSQPLRAGPSAWDELPSPLRRLGGVTCTSCHGPGAIPEASASWAILRSDVCATCHDAPPRYAHVIAWKKTRMARSDFSAGTKDDPCRRCHTTSGFLSARGIRPERVLPSPDATFGIACAACHAPHGAHVPGGLVRDIALHAAQPKLPKSARGSELCVSCHSTEPDMERGPSQAALVFGGDKPPHAAVPGGCVGCHMRGNEATPTGPRGQSHDFSPKPAACVPCHAAGRTETIASGASPVRERAQALWKKFGDPQLKVPPHVVQRTRDSEGLKKLLLVLEDPAAGVHNGPYARALLDEAEKLLR
jgi:hypothetical protein